MFRLSSWERVRRAAELAEPDMVPVAPYIGNHAAVLAGIPIDRYCTSGEAMARAQWEAWKIYGHDILAPISDTYYIAEGFGVEVDHHPDSTPTFRAPAVKELDAVERLEIPDPHRAGRMSVYLEAIRRLRDRVEDEAPIRAPGTGLFTLAGHLMGTERFLMEVALADAEPGGAAEGALRMLLDKTTQALAAFEKACLDAGARVLGVGDSLASSDVISPAMFDKWVLPFEKRLFAELNEHGKQYGALMLFHVCGNTTPILESMADCGAQLLELDSKVALRLAKERIGQRVCLVGNVDPSAVLRNGSVADVERAATQAIRDAGPRGGFILGSGCEVPAHTPRANIEAMIRVARNHRYPMDQ